MRTTLEDWRNLGNELSFVIGVNFEAKNSMKSHIASDKTLLATFNGRINGIFPIK